MLHALAVCAGNNNRRCLTIQFDQTATKSGDAMAHSMASHAASCGVWHSSRDQQMIASLE
jgi:hypothetical protein